MIVAAGLSPAWQQVMRFGAVRPGEVNRAREVHWCASGKVLNVAVALARLGAPVRAVTLTGGETGAQVDRDLRALGVETRLVTSQQPTRVCTTLLDEASGATTELVQNAPAATADELRSFETTFAEAVREAQFVVLSGSLPEGSPATFFRQLLAHTRSPAILDIRGAELLEALAARPLVVKPNREELATTVDRPLDTDASLHEAMHEMCERGASCVLTTAGAGAAWAALEGRTYRIQPPRVQAVNPIGSGDAVAAGMAWSLLRGDSLLSALRYGMAAGSANAAELLPVRIDRQRVEALAEQVFIEEW